MSASHPNTLWAAAFLDELARAGVRDLCVAPGSRSTPLVLAAAADGRLRMHPIVDERSAGFFALGLGKASGRPAAVLTTSGTAAANLDPAVIEASLAEVPLLVLTADRPHHLRDSDANQAMDQLRLFGSFPRGFFEVAPARVDGPALRHLRTLAVRAVALATGTPMGPVHLNFPLDKPLEPEGAPGASPEGFAREHPRAARGREGGEPFTRIRPRQAAVTEEDLARAQEALKGATRGLIVAGPVPDPDRVGPAVLALGAATGFPVLADPLSGARFAPPEGAQVVDSYDLFLRSPQARAVLEPDLVLRVGASPTSAPLLDYLAGHGEVRQMVVDDGHRWKDHLASSHDYLQAPAAALLSALAARARPTGSPAWRALWREAGARARRVLENLPPGALLEGEVVAAVVAALPEGSNLLVASSMPIRDLDAFAPPASRRLHLFGNRGVSGIDGLVSTTLGIAAAPDAPGQPRPTVGILGDLAFFHDMNGLLALRTLGLRAVFVVINNDGGGIFHTLPVRQHEPAFTRFFATPHGLEFARAAELYGIPHALASDLGQFERALARALEAGGAAIVEVRSDREATHLRRREVVAAVVEAMRGLGGALLPRDPHPQPDS